MTQIIINVEKKHIIALSLFLFIFMINNSNFTLASAVPYFQGHPLSELFADSDLDMAQYKITNVSRLNVTQLEIKENMIIGGNLSVAGGVLCLADKCISDWSSASITSTWANNNLELDESDYCTKEYGSAPTSWSYYDRNQSGNCIIARFDDVVVSCPVNFTTIETKTITKTGVSCYDGRCTGGWACIPHSCTTSEHIDWQEMAVESCIRNDCWSRYNRRAGSYVYARVTGTRCTHI